ncbi:MAG: SpoIIE family protein phosphatase [Bacteroidales bacterium]
MVQFREISVSLLAAAILTAGPAKPVSGQSPETGVLPIYNFTPKEYNALEQNWCATEDNRGVLYFGNNAGILEYDGAHWTLTPPSNGSPVHSIATSSKGRVYFGSVNKFGYLATDSIGQLAYFLLSDLLTEAQQDFNEIWETHAVGETIYFQSYHKIFTWQNDSLHVFRSEQEIQESFLVNDDLFLSFPDAGLSYFHNNTLTPVSQGELPENSQIYGMIETKPGKILIITEKNGFCELQFNRNDPSASTIRKIQTGNDRIFRETEIYNVQEIGRGMLSLGTWGDGVLIVDSLFNIVQVLTRETGLQDQVIQGQYLDRYNNLWLTLGSGISRVEVQSPVTSFQNAQGLNGIIQSVTRFNDRIYVASNTGLYFFDSRSDSPFPHNSFSLVKDFGMECWELLTYKNEGDEALLVITNEKVFEIRSNHSYEAVVKDYAYTLCQSSAYPRRVHIGLENGFTSIYRENGSWKQEEHAAEVRKMVTSIAEDQDGNLWLGTLDEGIVRVGKEIFHGAANGKSLVRHFGEEDGLPSGPFVMEMVGEKIVAATNKGIFCLKDNGSTFIADTTLGKLFSEDELYVHRISANQDSLVYIVTFQENAEVQYKVGFLERTGTGYRWIKEPFRSISEELNHALYEDRDGIVWLGGSHGLFRYDPVNRAEPTAFSAKISSVEVTGTRTLFKGAFSGDERLPVSTQPSSQKFVLPYSENSLTFLFGALTGQNEDFTRYNYFLEGNDKNWSDFTPESKKEYTNLREGRYTFRVKARTLYTHESSEATYEFSVLAPWYRKWWAFVIYTVIAAAIVYLIIIFYTRQLRAIIRERTAEVVAQKEVIEEKNKDIMDSVLYAEKIQRAILPPADDLSKMNLEGFVLFLPRDYVSGDFYWLGEKNGKIITVAADSTGHGVPGAFMSMLGIAFLNNIIIAKGVISAGEILNQLRSEVIFALKQKGQEGEQKDGMDLALHVIDLESMKLEFAGANNPLIMIRDNELIQVKADRMPIGIHERVNEPFTNHVIDLQKGDVFYTFSDGYQDQFGGPQNKKFMIKRLKELFLEIHHKPMEEQRNILHRTFFDWISYGSEQIDDVIVTGIRV